MGMVEAAALTLSLGLPADDLCLAYVNSRYWRNSPRPSEDLNGIDDVGDWIATHLPESGPALARSAAHWDAGPEHRTTAFAAAIGLREILYRALRSAAEEQTPDITGINIMLRQAAARQALEMRDGRIGWSVPPPSTASVAALLSPVLWSAADLLTGPRRGRLRLCANPVCGFLFIDDSKSANRRWCTMTACGNRAKAQRHYQKAKAARAPR
ncbi:MAG: CGNR zinc finger domain-containing protein [Alphaproteobacteria bacterium]|nr:CGNR zinc finger domain-containing protein [Alphaproteobacteria bacterium]